MLDIDVRKVKEHYEIYVNGNFHASADNMQEVTEELSDIDSLIGDFENGKAN